MTPSVQKITTTNKAEFYSELMEQAASIQDTKLPIVSNLSNLSSLLYFALNDIGRRVNWVGFYIYNGTQLVLGPFQGRLACTQIRIGKGVCGTAAEQQKTILVQNVHEFKGHIACDSETESEIVVPIVLDGELFGVLDLDALNVSEFDEEDQQGLEAIVETIIKNIKTYSNYKEWVQ
jgi:putative methionine-R-sulfoxide reductase with GAF domain